MCNHWIYLWEINKDKARDHTDVQSLNLTASINGSDKIRNFTADLLKQSCNDVEVEPQLEPIDAGNMYLVAQNYFIVYLKSSKLFTVAHQWQEMKHV